MRRLSIIFILFAACLASFAEIPAGKTIYLDVTQHWCCQASYYVYLSRTGQSYLMTPVPGNDGVYQFTTIASTQENFRFCYTATPAAGATVSGQQSPHTEDINNGNHYTGKWSDSTPYFIMDAEDGKKGHWAAAPSVSGTSAITSADAQFVYDCAQEEYSLELQLIFSGAPCGLKLSGPLFPEGKIVKRPASPYELSLSEISGVPGDSYTLTIAIYSDVACSNQIESRDFTLVLPDKDCAKTIPVNLCVGDEDVTLSSSVNVDVYLWSNNETERSIVVSPTKPGTTTYSVTAYKTVVTPEKNLMLGGDFESNDGFTADYSYAGTFTKTSNGDYYDKSSLKSNLYALVKNANGFWRDFESVSAHGGSYFGLFDAGKSGYAWKAETNCASDHSKDNPNLILLKDSVYLFSYWAANPNNASQNNSPAILQFVIEYTDQNGTPGKVDLGEPFTLPNDNEWHQQQVTWKSPVTSANVLIGVYDKNNNSGVGNDFCLDDIMFQTVSFSSSLVAYTDHFIVSVTNCDCDLIVYRKWNDFLFVDNSDSLYTSYQWYLNGQPIEGATGQYYCMPSAPSSTDEFYVVANGSIESCHTTFADASPSAAVYPATSAKAPVATRSYIVSDHFAILVTLFDDGSVETQKQVIY